MQVAVDLFLDYPSLQCSLRVALPAVLQYSGSHAALHVRHAIS